MRRTTSPEGRRTSSTETGALICGVTGSGFRGSGFLSLLVFALGGTLFVSGELLSDLRLEAPYSGDGGLMLSAAGVSLRATAGVLARAVRAQVPLVITALYEIEAERERIDVLRAELDVHFDTAESQLETPEVLLSFVRHPRAYSLRHNSNTAIAGWLETLGCRVRGPAILARWHIDRPTTGDTR